MEEQTERARTPFTQIVQQQRKGALHGELSDAIAELVAECADTGKVGSLTLAIKVSPLGEGTVQITDTVKLSLPQRNKGASTFFHDESGNLSRNNPAQPELPLGTVKEATG